MGRVKGVLLVELVRLLRKNRARIEKETSVSGELAEYLTQRVVLHSWYPEEHFVQMLRLAGKLTERAGRDDLYFRLGEATAQAHHSGEKASFSPSELTVAENLKWLRGIWGTHHDSGHLTVAVGKGKATIELRDFAPLCREYGQVLVGWGVGFLRAAGARSSQVRRIDSGSPSTDGVFELSWEEP